MKNFVNGHVHLWQTTIDNLKKNRKWMNNDFSMDRVLYFSPKNNTLLICTIILNKNTNKTYISYFHLHSLKESHYQLLFFAQHQLNIGNKWRHDLAPNLNERICSSEHCLVLTRVVAILPSYSKFIYLLSS